jgi:hypothetical protein
MENQYLELTKLQIEFVVGMDAKGEDIIQKRTLSNINNSVDGVSLKKCADAIISLQKHNVVGVKRLDTWEI